ncbi:MAG: ABC transporter substrate-binding protein [Bdellovibrionaceae bacterium]|nr:ABC transporter substrate-binding protein [Pseudobdellovibrionaceae bacterium]
MYKYILLLLLPSIANANENIPTYLKYTYLLSPQIIPSDALSTSEHAFSNLVYTGLFKLNNDGSYENELVNTYNFNFENKYIEIEINNNAYFHDGSKITNKDVKYSLNYLINKSKNKNSFSSIKNIMINKSKIYIFTDFSEPIIPLLASPLTKIWKKSGTNIIGSGPYKIIEVNFSEKIVELSRFEKYIHLGEYSLEKIKIVQTSEKKAIEDSLSGKSHDMLDFVINNPSKITKNIYSTIINKPISATWIMSFNLQNPFLKNEKVRNCIRQAFPKEIFVKKFLPYHQLASSYLPPTILLQNNKNSEANKIKCENIALKNELILDYPIEIAQAKEQCEFISSYLKKSGIHIKCNIIEFPKVLERIQQKKWQLSILAMSAEVPSIYYLVSPFYSKASFNLINSEIIELDNLLLEARNTPTKQNKFSTFMKIDNFLIKNNLILPISHPVHYSIKNNCIKGLTLNTFGPSYLNYRNVFFKKECL